MFILKIELEKGHSYISRLACVQIVLNLWYLSVFGLINVLWLVGQTCKFKFFALKKLIQFRIIGWLKALLNTEHATAL